MMFARVTSQVALIGATALIVGAVAASSIDVSNPLETPLYGLVADDALTSFATHSERISRPDPTASPAPAAPRHENPWVRAAAAAHGLSVRSDAATPFPAPIAELEVDSVLAWHRAERALARGDLTEAESEFGAVEPAGARLAVEARMCEATARVRGPAACRERVEELIAGDATFAPLLTFAVDDDADDVEQQRAQAFECLLAGFHSLTVEALGDDDEGGCADLARRLYRALYLGKSRERRGEALELARATVRRWPTAREAWTVLLGLLHEADEDLGEDELESLREHHPDLLDPGGPVIDEAAANEPVPPVRTSRKRTRRELHDHGGRRFVLVDRLVALGRLDAAAGMCREIYGEDPRCAIATHRLADVLARAGRGEAAAEKYRLALRLNPELKCVHAHLHELDPSVSADADPTADWLERLEVGETTPAELELFAGRVEDVVVAEALTAWLAGDQTDPRILIARAALNDRVGRRVAALADLEAALSRSPSRIAWYADLLVELRGAAGDAEHAVPAAPREAEESAHLESCRRLAEEEPAEALRQLQAIPLGSPLAPRALRLAARIHRDAGRSVVAELLPVHLAVINELILSRCREWIEQGGLVGAVGRFAMAEFLVDAEHELDQAEKLIRQVRGEVEGPSLDALTRRLARLRP